MAFAPGELSTVAQHQILPFPQILTTEPFNFADLPCPPQSLMVGPLIS